MSESLTAAVVLLVTTGARDGFKTFGFGVSVDCGKINRVCSEGGGVEADVGGYDPAGRIDVLLGETEE